jgi:hypothetical protein
LLTERTTALRVIRVRAVVPGGLGEVTREELRDAHETLQAWAETVRADPDVARGFNEWLMFGLRYVGDSPEDLAALKSDVIFARRGYVARLREGVHPLPPTIAATLGAGVAPDDPTRGMAVVTYASGLPSTVDGARVAQGLKYVFLMRGAAVPGREHAASDAFDLGRAIADALGAGMQPPPEPNWE